MSDTTKPFVSDERHKDQHKSKPSKRKGRNSTRFEKLREKRGDEFQNERKEKIKQSIFTGTSTSNPADKTNRSEVLQSLTISITSRQVGFGLMHMLTQSQNFTNIVYTADCYEMYRVYLALFEHIMSHILKESGVTLRFPLDHYQYEDSSKFRTVVRSNNVVPYAISLLIEQLGTLTVYENTYIPVVRANYYDAEDMFVPLPETVMYSNLEMTVAALHDPQTPLAYRQRFRRLSPLPGAVWSDDDFLVNHMDFWPANYTLDQLQRETLVVSNTLSSIEKQMNKLVTTIPFKDKYIATRSLLMSNDMGNLRQSERLENQDLLVYYKSAVPFGNVTDYWSRFSMSQSEKLRGHQCLLGELCSSRGLAYPVYTPRLAPICPWENKTSYLGVIQSMYSG